MAFNPREPIVPIMERSVENRLTFVLIFNELIRRNGLTSVVLVKTDIRQFNQPFSFNQISFFLGIHIVKYLLYLILVIFIFLKK